MFDVNAMPMGSSDAQRKALENHGRAELEELCISRYNSMDVDELKNQALRFRFYVRDNHHVFYHDSKLIITGPGSIFEALFTNSDALGAFAPIPDFLAIADDMISMLVTQCATERIGRRMGLTKSLLRSNMTDDLFDALLFLGANMAPIHETDIDSLCKKFLKAGHLPPYTANGSGSRVLSRLIKQTKHTMILKRPPNYTTGPHARQWSEFRVRPTVSSTTGNDFHRIHSVPSDVK